MNKISDEKNKLTVTPVSTSVTGEIPDLLLAIAYISEMVIKLPATENNVIEVNPRIDISKPVFMLITAPSAPPEDTPRVYGVARSLRSSP